MDPNDVPRWLKVTGIAWPIAAAVLAAGVMSVRSDAHSEAVEERVTVLEQSGAPVVRERLARMEERQISQGKVLERMEAKIDQLEAR